MAALRGARGKGEVGGSGGVRRGLLAGSGMCDTRLYLCGGDLPKLYVQTLGEEGAATDPIYIRVGCPRARALTSSASPSP